MAGSPTHAARWLERFTPQALLVALAGCAFHVPHLWAPISALHVNGGRYFGPSVRAYEQFGFWNLRGMPTWLQPGERLNELWPYLQHPPGLFWAMACFGTDELALRLPTMVAAIVAAIMLLALLRPRLGPWPALVAALCLLGSPAFTCWGQLSYEPGVIMAGLALWLTTLRLRDAGAPDTRRRWRAAQVAVCLIGPWSDWSFGLYCIGLAVLTQRRPLRAWAGELLVPAVCTATSAGAVIAWRSWAAAAPFVRADFRQMGFVDMAGHLFSDRPSTGEFAVAAAHMLDLAATVPLIAVGAVGAALLARHEPRLVAAMFAAAAIQVVMYAEHSLTHVMFYCYAVVLLAAGAGALVARLAQWRGPVAIAAAALLVQTWVASIALRSGDDSPAFRDLGRAAMAAVRDAPGDAKRPVMSNAERIYPYYAYTRNVLATPVAGPVAGLEAFRATSRNGYAYFFFERTTRDGTPTDPALTAWSERYPRTPLPDLTAEFARLDADPDLEMIWLVSVPPADR